jgi:flagellin
LDFVGTKAGIKGASVVMGYLETGMRVLDSASGLLSRLQELAVLGANDTNTEEDHEAINLEAEAIADEFNRLMQTSTYKGKDVFATAANSEYVSMGGRNAEMTFGLARIDYTELYDAERTIAAGMGPNAGTAFNLVHLASDGAADIELDALVNGETYIIANLGTNTGLAGEATGVVNAIAADSDATAPLVVGTEFTMTDDVDVSASDILYTQPTNTLTKDIQAVQAKLNTARVQAGSQYAALESAVNYTTDLTAMYELGYNTVNDVNFSMETAHLAKNQILQQAATAMLAQANQGQQGLLQLIQG